MALLTDSDVVTSADLLLLDSEVDAVASAQDYPITIDGPSGIIRQAWDETADRIFEKMDSFGGAVNLLVGAGVQMATLLTNYGMGVSRARIFLTQIMVSDGYANRTSPLKRYLIYKSLEGFYRDAAERMTQADRYERKRDRYSKDGSLAWRRFSSKGLPMVLQPLPCPGAIHEVGAGTWSGANVSAVVSGGALGGIWDVVITWVDQSKYVNSLSTGNAESGPSATATVTIASGHAISISIAGLTPPNGKPFQSGTYADGILAIANATGWNIYAGPTGGLLTLQNATPIPVATSSSALAGDPSSLGGILLPGQQADANYAFLNTLQRA